MPPLPAAEYHSALAMAAAEVDAGRLGRQLLGLHPASHALPYYATAAVQARAVPRPYAPGEWEGRALEAWLVVADRMARLAGCGTGQQVDQAGAAQADDQQQQQGVRETAKRDLASLIARSLQSGLRHRLACVAGRARLTYPSGLLLTHTLLTPELLIARAQLALGPGGVSTHAPAHLASLASTLHHLTSAVPAPPPHYARTAPDSRTAGAAAAEAHAVQEMSSAALSVLRDGGRGVQFWYNDRQLLLKKGHDIRNPVGWAACLPSHVIVPSAAAARYAVPSAPLRVAASPEAAAAAVDAALLAILGVAEGRAGAGGLLLNMGAAAYAGSLELLLPAAGGQARVRRGCRGAAEIARARENRLYSRERLACGM